MEKLQLFPFLGNINQTINSKGVKGDFFSVLLSLIESFNQKGEIKEEPKEILNFFDLGKKFKQISGEKEEVEKNLNVNPKMPVVSPLIFPVDNIIKEKNTKIDNERIHTEKEINMEGSFKQKKANAVVIVEKIFVTKAVKAEEHNKREEISKFSSNRIPNKITYGKLEFLEIYNFKEEKPIPKESVLKRYEIVKDEKNPIQQFQKNDTDTLINIKNLIKIKKNYKPEETFVDFPIKELKNSKKEEKSDYDLKKKPPVIVEIKELPRENIETKRVEIKKIVKDFTVIEEKNVKKVKVEIKDMGIEMRFLKENATLFLRFKDFNNSFITNYDAVRISQIFQSAGFRLESLNVNGSEIYRDREKERERSNIGVNETDENTDNTTSSNFSILL
ncbi:hypothetical protein JCM9492_13800 [Aquifex pyrophilus]